MHFPSYVPNDTITNDPLVVIRGFLTLIVINNRHFFVVNNVIWIECNCIYNLERFLYCVRNSALTRTTDKILYTNKV